MRKLLLLLTFWLWAAPAHAVLQCALMSDADYTVTQNDTCVLIAAVFTVSTLGCYGTITAERTN